MEKIGVVLVVLNPNVLQQALMSLNFEKATPVAILVDGGGGNFLNVTDLNLQIPIFSFAQIQQVVAEGKDFAWLICGAVRGESDAEAMRKFLEFHGVSKENIVNFEIFNPANVTWCANLRFAEKNKIDFFSTGSSITEIGLDINFFSEMGKGINLACDSQDLRQSFFTAKHVFEHSPGKIKFVFIGLTPYTFRYENDKSFAVCPRDLKYNLLLENFETETRHGKLLAALVNDDVKKFFLNISSAQADPNFEELKRERSQDFPAHRVLTWKKDLEDATKIFRPETFEKNLQILEDYIKLCLAHGAKPIGITFPFAPIIRDNYDKNLLTLFRSTIRQLEKIYDFTFIDMFDLPLDYTCFYNALHLTLKGSSLSCSVLSARLHEKNILPFENLGKQSYEFFANLSYLLPKDEYNELMEKIFRLSVKKLRKKKKIKVAFVTDNAAMWCGDKLYNYFAESKRYDPTIFLCLNQMEKNSPTVMKDFRHGLEQFKSRGLNVLGLTDEYSSVPRQDVLIFLRPYPEYYPNALHLDKLDAETLMTYIPYSFRTSTWDIANLPFFHVAWKIFFETDFDRELNEKKSAIGLPRAYFSGYPKMDIFFDKNANLNYEWKSQGKPQKKIIYAPHWSIDSGVKYSTFQWNYQFMYDFAKSHPEISWVVKPHPHLLSSAVGTGLFPSVEAFEEYLQKWNDLPNAKVETGAYYQAIFETSDGMIQDSGSFIIEYQYTHKPMIFLTRDTQEFNDLGNEIMKVLYRVDGKDFQGIADLMEKIFIEGKDELFEERKKFFDENLNYQKLNGISASEFIFKSISDELK